MNKKIAIVIAVILIILGIYFFSQSNKFFNQGESSEIEAGQRIEGYSGKVLAGTKTPYLDFNKADYNKALSENKTILLYFYATWCPICKEEQKKTIGAFNELNKENFIGFRVNYNDGDTDADERELAKQFGISYQHTKIIIKSGKQVLKAPDSWNKERYIEEINKFA